VREGRRQEKEGGKEASLSHLYTSMNYESVTLVISLRSARLFIFTIESETVYRTSPM
jgi:hypothetical protein